MRTMELPSGRVTMLFSDIEGSTRLVRDMGEGWGEVLQLQRDLARRSWSAHGGHEMGTEGDSFFVVFSTVQEAFDAALDFQRGMQTTTWPEGSQVNVRVGIHTGTPQRHADGYIGLDVHKAARVAGSGHGGQTVVSETAIADLPDGLSRGAQLLDLGSHRLKDLDEGIHLFQLTAPDLRSSFPPLKTLGTAGNLPAPNSPIVGREGELRALGDLLSRGARVVTLTGAGGSGKTRLATALASQLAGDFDGGVYFVSLSTATTATEIWSLIADVLSLEDDESSYTRVLEYLAQRRTLLVLDNVEQVIEPAARVVNDLLDQTKEPVFVVTSRRPLHVTGEHEHVVPPLKLPAQAKATATLDEASASGAVQMFAMHAQRARSGFSLTEQNAGDIAELCRALDGLPLALEIAAARTKLLSPRAILGRIDSSLDLSSPDPTQVDRHRTLRDTIRWSFDLLDRGHQVVMTHLSVFDGGATLDAIAAVAPSTLIGGDITDALFDLVDASLVVVEEHTDGEPRFSLLATVKRFADDQLRTEEMLEQALIAHAQHFYDWIRGLVLRPGELTRQDLEDLSTENPNIRAVLERGVHRITEPWAVETPLPPAQAATLLIRGAMLRGNRLGLDDLTALAFAFPPDDIGTSRLHHYRGWQRMMSGDLDRCESDARAALDLAAPLLALPTHELPAIAAVWIHPARTAVNACTLLVTVYLERGDLREAGRFATLAQRLAEGFGPEIESHAHDGAYQVAYEQGDFDLARTHYERREGLGPLGAFANNMADLDLQQGHLCHGQAVLAETFRAGTAFNVNDLIIAAETFAAIIGHEHPSLCARTYGSTMTARNVEGIPNQPTQQAEDERALAPIKDLLGADAWREAFERGQSESLHDLIQEMVALPPLQEDRAVH